MSVTQLWRKEPGARLQGSRPLDNAKLQAPCIVRVPNGGFRLFYTAVGSVKPFPACQGYILSAVSDDGLLFRTEPGIRLAPRPLLPHMSLRVIAPSITQCADGRWRMYFESRGPADRPTVICSAISSDLLAWELEDGIRLQNLEGVGAPRYVQLPYGRGRLYCSATEFGPGGIATGQRVSTNVISAITSDGLHFEFEPGYRMRDKQGDYDTAGISAAEVVPPSAAGEGWTLFYSAWQDVPREPGCHCIRAWILVPWRAERATTSRRRRSQRIWQDTGRGSTWLARPTAWFGIEARERLTDWDTGAPGWTQFMPRTCHSSESARASTGCTMRLATRTETGASPARLRLQGSWIDRIRPARHGLSGEQR